VEAERQAWCALVLHVTNLRNSVSKDRLHVEVVFFGVSLNMRLKNTAGALETVGRQRVTLAACQNARRFLNVKTEDLFPFASPADSGVAEIVRKEKAG
jgi:intracellular sulfur oxidation DsrE/DsrF family protein